jgi:3-dehydroquinate synthase
VTDARVGRLYGASAAASLRRAGIVAHAIVLPAGERAKRIEPLSRTWSELARYEVGRADAIVGLGGGVVGDIAGFAAATWLRGVPWINVPSTVVAQADSCIGGKTGIDLGWGKNLVGAFHHPACVLVDPDLLATLPDREYRAGMAEVAKTGFAVDRDLFARFERDTDRLRDRRRAALEPVLSMTLAAKARVVVADEREREGGVRTALNFGHTLGHALEAALDYRILKHGEAVAIGMRFACRLSMSEAGLAAADTRRLDRVLDAWRLPRGLPDSVTVLRLEQHLARDKKRRGGVRWVLTPRMGRASVPRLISDRRIRAALMRFGARHG